MNGLLRRMIWSVLVVSLWGTPARAQESLKKVAELRVYHATPKEVVVIDGTGARRDVAALEPHMQFSMPKDTRVRIVIYDANPLLFTYGWKGVTSTPTTNGAQAATLAEILTTVADNLKSFTTAQSIGAKSAAAIATQANTDLAIAQAESSAITARVLSLRSGGKSVPLNLQNENTATEARLAAAQREAVRAAAAAAVLAELQKTRQVVIAAGVTPELLNELGTNLKYLAEMVKGIEKTTRLSAYDHNAAKGQAAILTADLDARAAAVTASYATIEKAGASVLESFDKLGLAGDSLLTAMTLALHYEAETMDAIKAVKTLRTHAAAIDQPIEVGTIPYSPDSVQTATFTIAKREGVPAIDGDRSGTGEFSASVEAVGPVAYSVAPAYVYTWIRKVAGASGQQIAGVLNIVPRRWVGSDFSAGFSFGLTGDASGAGFLVGFKVTLAQGVQLGLGAIYKDVSKEGRDFRPGGYVLLAADLGAKK